MKELRSSIKKYSREMRKYRSRRDMNGVQRYNEARCEYLKLLERQEI